MRCSACLCAREQVISRRRSGAPRPSSPPKLEDFLGGGINGAGSGGPVSVAETPAAEMYDSDLKFIAAGFMQSGAVGAAAPSPVSSCSLDQADPKLGLPAAAVPAPEQWKAVGSFGQRTSIYRGVTRSDQYLDHKDIQW